MSTQIGTIGKPFGSRSIMAIVTAAIVVLGVVAAMFVFRGTSEPIRRPQVSAVATEQTTTPVEANTPTETMLIKGGLQPRPVVSKLTEKQVRELQLAATGIEQVSQAEGNSG
jgi:hypothetical protein